MMQCIILNYCFVELKPNSYDAELRTYNITYNSMQIGALHVALTIVNQSSKAHEIMSGMLNDIIQVNY